MEQGFVTGVRPYTVVGEIRSGKQIWRPGPLSSGLVGRVDTGKGSREGETVHLREWKKDGERSGKNISAGLLPLPPVGWGVEAGVTICHQHRRVGHLARAEASLSALAGTSVSDSRHS